MSIKFINNLPIIAIMTPFILAFILGLFKNKYIRVKSSCSYCNSNIIFMCNIIN